MGAWVDVEKSLMDVVHSGALTPAEARMVQKDRDAKKSGKLVVIQGAPGSMALSQEYANKLVAAVKEATGAGRVIILPPGYYLND